MTLKNIILSAIQSKRFVAFCIGVVLFVSLTLITDKTPIELATAVGILTTIYIGGDTIRKSDYKDSQTT
jgi:hypothetical protein